MSKTKSKNANLFILANPVPNVIHPLVSIFRGNPYEPERGLSIVCNSCTPEEAKEIVRAVNEHAALCAVAEAAQEFISVAGSLPFMKYSGSHYEQWKAAKDALTQLAAVRKGAQ